MKLFTTHKPKLEDCPPSLKQNIISWQTYNPSFEFEYFCEEQMTEWIKNNTSSVLLDCFNSLNTGAGRADFYRIRKLFVEGGIWFDADLPANDILKRVPDLIEILNNHKTTFFVSRKRNEPRFMIMASFSGNPIFSEFENQVYSELNECRKNKIFIETIDLTGPKAFHRLLCKYLNYKTISELNVGDSFNRNGISFVFLDDVVDYTSSGDDITKYKKYRRDLKNMGLEHHKSKSAYK